MDKPEFNYCGIFFSGHEIVTTEIANTEKDAVWLRNVFKGLSTIHSKYAKSLATYVKGIKAPPNANDYKITSSSVVEALNAYSESANVFATNLEEELANFDQSYTKITKELDSIVAEYGKKNLRVSQMRAECDKLAMKTKAFYESIIALKDSPLKFSDTAQFELKLRGLHSQAERADHLYKSAADSTKDAEHELDVHIEGSLRVLEHLDWDTRLSLRETTMKFTSSLMNFIQTANLAIAPLVNKISCVDVEKGIQAFIKNHEPTHIDTNEVTRYVCYQELLYPSGSQRIKKQQSEAKEFKNDLRSDYSFCRDSTTEMEKSTTQGKTTPSAPPPAGGKPDDSLNTPRDETGVTAAMDVVPATVNPYAVDQGAGMGTSQESANPYASNPYAGQGSSYTIEEAYEEDSTRVQKDGDQPPASQEADDAKQDNPYVIS